MNSILYQSIISLSRDDCMEIEAYIQRITASNNVNIELLVYLYIGQYYICTHRYHEAYLILKEGIDISRPTLGKMHPITLTMLYLLLIIGIRKGCTQIVYEIIDTIEHDVPDRFRSHFHVLRDYLNTRTVTKLIRQFEEFGEKNNLLTRSFSTA